mmetsp:Transcript_2056/g.4973  ORF Transcript_2056/g.4973 Transcript_2056/m.4973 type:complete len:295 (+) Transcript_2056:483-1367(+)
MEACAASCVALAWSRSARACCTSASNRRLLSLALCSSLAMDVAAAVSAAMASGVAAPCNFWQSSSSCLMRPSRVSALALALAVPTSSLVCCSSMARLSCAHSSDLRAFEASNLFRRSSSAAAFVARSRCASISAEVSMALWVLALHSAISALSATSLARRVLALLRAASLRSDASAKRVAFVASATRSALARIRAHSSCASQVFARAAVSSLPKAATCSLTARKRAAASSPRAKSEALASVDTAMLTRLGRRAAGALSASVRRRAASSRTSAAHASAESSPPPSAFSAQRLRGE